jgi:perosamine synthetase
MNRTISLGCFQTTPRMRDLMNQVLDSGRLSYGPLSQQLEHDFAALHGCRHGILAASGTDALLATLEALKMMHGWADGGEVLVPATTFVATINIIIQSRLTPVLVDVDPDYYQIDLADAERRVTSRTKAILPVHLFGQSCDMAAVSDLATAWDLSVLEDSCEAMFVKYQGQPVGSMGDAGCFSTYMAHLLVTGVGGLTTTNNPDLAAKVRSLQNHGRDGIYISIDDDNLENGPLHQVISRRFRFESIGHSSRITEMQAAIGLAQLDNWQYMIAERQSNARCLTAALSDCEDWLQLPRVRPGAEHAFMMYPIVLKTGREGRINKVALVNHLEEHGIETRDMMPILSQPCYGKFGWNPASYPVASWIDKGGFYIGCHQGLDASDMRYVAETIAEFCGQ